MFKHYRILIISIILKFSFSGCEPFALSAEELSESAPLFIATTLSETTDDQTRFRVMSWNIKYGAKRNPFWFDCWGDQVSMSQAEVSANMESLYEMIKEVKPDILMVEEIELHSRRSAYYDMIQGILDHTALNYAAYYLSCRYNFYCTIFLYFRLYSHYIYIGFIYVRKRSIESCGFSRSGWPCY